MKDAFERSRLLYGHSGQELLIASSVAVIGIGGVGSYTAEALIRSGVGKIILVDYDLIDISNINRQIHANINTIGMSKVKVMADRLTQINPRAEILYFNERISEENIEFLFKEKLDYIADAIDDVKAKVLLIKEAKDRGIEIISSMGTGNKLNPLDFKVAKIKDTKNCPLSRVMRKRLREMGIENVKVVYSEEINEYKFSNPVGSTSFTPAVAGLVIASEIVKDLLKGGRYETNRGSNRNR